MAVRVALIFLMLATPAVYAVQHIVGGSGGWNTAGDYSTWSSGETFNLGDTLVFNYDSSHGVDVVSKDDYDNCNAGNALESHTGGKTTITLSKAGLMHFMCPTTFHCGQGMKLAVNVKAAGGSPGGSPAPSGSSPTTPSTPSDPTTPSNSPPSNKNSPSSTNGATGTFGIINHLMLGLSLVLAALFVRI